MLTSFTLENYRAFVDPTTVELRPLTLLFGYNNSGKSALVRALALIAASGRQDARMPLDLKSEAARDCNFDELRSKLCGSDTIRIGLSFDNGDLVAEYDIAQPAGGLRQVVTEMRVKQGATSAVLQWVPGPGRAPSYAVQWNGEPTDILVEHGFVGLMPENPKIISGDQPAGAKVALMDMLGDLGRRLATHGLKTHWLGSIRHYPPRSVRYRGEGLSPIGSDGSGAGDHLADDKLTSGPLLAEVSAWYEGCFHRKLDVLQSADGAFSITIEPVTMGAGRQVNLADTGEGMAQVLPVLLAAAMARRGERDDPAILAIEQPELHLHPKVHAPLAKHLCDLAAKAEAPPRMLIETHSENFLLGVQIQIVRGELPPGRVLVYWVKQLDDGVSYVQRIEFDDEGFPRGFPDDVFNEDLELAQLLLALRERAAG